MKILSGLKVEAVAIITISGFKYEIVKTVNGSALASNDGNSYWVNSLPEGEWTILGRANEILSNDDLSKLFQPEIPTSLFITWEQYMEANNLTNELILIKQ